MTATVTHHAAQRWIDRIDGSATHAQARAAILASSRAIETAAEFKCCQIKLGCGARLILSGSRVVTVYSRGMWARGLRSGGGAEV